MSPQGRHGGILEAFGLASPSSLSCGAASPVAACSAMKAAYRMTTFALGALFFVYFWVCVAVWWYQDKLIYPGAVPYPDYLNLASQFGVVPYDAPDGTLLGFVAAAQPPVAPAHGTIIVFHGNGAVAPYRTAYIDALQPRGFRVILYEYPGYGGRLGRPTERSIVAEGRALVNRLAAAGEGPVYLCGESIGSGVVGSIAADPAVPVQGIVLITPFHSLAGIAEGVFPILPISLMIRDHYNTVDNLAHFAHPIFVMQAAEDSVIGAWSTEKLLAGLPTQTQSIILPDCGHSDWPSGPAEPWWDKAVSCITKK